MARPVCRRLAVAVALLGSVAQLSGCTGDQSVSQDVALDANSGANSGGNAIILVGLRVATEPTQYGLFNLFSREVHPVYEVAIRQMSPDGGFARLVRQVNICDSVRALINGVLSDCVPGQVRYKVLSVPAGRYTVESIAYQVERRRYVTIFNRQTENGMFDSSTGIVQPVLDPARSFTVDGGSITYIGDLSFSFDPASAGARMALERNDTAARNALATYPNLHATPVFRPATGRAGTAAVPTGLPPIEGPI